ncbi:hypothetical protein JCM19046_1407 [Bacillus sp. JCM 19046]|nr:hypothetical protein JCM19045_582 [Bacillus sp. JCM 19045]GAF16941.1 hypothetical protein JCM19046_1407 [Bacillus sp. JCM 19046]
MKAIVAIPVFLIVLSLIIMGLAWVADFFFRQSIATILSIPAAIIAIVIALVAAKKASDGIEEVLK